MAKDTKHLWNRNGNWWFQIAVPERHRDAFGGKKTIAEPLKTDSLSRAQGLRDEKLADFRRKIRNLDGEFGAEDIAAEVKRWNSDNSWGLGYLFHDAEIEEQFGAEIAGIAQHRGVDIPKGSDRWRALGLALLKTLRADQHRDVADAMGELAEPVIVEPPRPSNGAAFGALLVAYRNSRQAAGSNAETLQTIERIGRRFEQHLADAAVATVDSQVAVAFREVLRAEGRDIRTINKHMSTLKSIFEHGRNDGLFPAAIPNPFHGKTVAMTKLELERRKRVPYKPEEFQAILDGMSFNARPRSHSIDSALPWVTLIAAFTGARREDICSLRVEDVAEHEGVLSFAFGHGDYVGKTVAAAKRLTPVHSTLVLAGLLRYRDNLKAGEKWLFPGLSAKPSRPDKRGGNLGDRYRDLLQRVGVTRHGLNFHAWRNTVITALQRAGVVVEDRELIVGHEGRGVNRGYVALGPEDLARLSKLVERINYNGVRVPATNNLTGGPPLAGHVLPCHASSSKRSRVS
jgi:integrase